MQSAHIYRSIPAHANSDGNKDKIPPENSDDANKKHSNQGQQSFDRCADFYKVSQHQSMFQIG